MRTVNMIIRKLSIIQTRGEIAFKLSALRALRILFRVLKRLL